MTITEAIAQLETIKEKHGDVDVYFDCPRCDQSYTPDVVKPVAAHMSAKKVLGGKPERS